MLLMAVITADDKQFLVLADGVANHAVGLFYGVEVAKIAGFMRPCDQYGGLFFPFCWKSVHGFSSL
jgi:hypothetical protein